MPTEDEVVVYTLLADTPHADISGQTPPRQTLPHLRQPLQRTVRILLECILVEKWIHKKVLNVTEILIKKWKGLNFCLRYALFSKNKKQNIYIEKSF